MLMPRIFGERTFDDFWDFPMKRLTSDSMMRTDVKEADGKYELAMDLPGFRKEDIKASLKDGYLTISAVTDRNNDKKDESGRYIRRERYSGSCSRSFYVGESVREEDIKAKFEDGTLTVLVPKEENEPKIEEDRYIAIEG
ncbi:molecular chaperone Hsp20 [Lachnospiraceae bacterium]|uniref:Hsp20/alpha crystallin family protein n=1 Tax=Extibacter sp. GGCC_0201 TaxID=2731209 RepID=UPI001AA0F2F5|nr:Hsp20/alpha crystallin family protein [Extibacter sp. GGCC_0201]MBO1721849.1 Hsp20/alpha crystallin family protein [Extibacter sp. GGCC_0201]BDF35094.1 molecular chaperone Hsp20 [Lachnospiraceae bacterium]BDF39095.1 molecular chaperone Hsp20 [Lachnospiraceae bacterium]